MTATAAPITTPRSTPEPRWLRRLAVILMTVVASIVVSMVIALAVLAAADVAGVDVRVPEPGPIPQPSVAPAGLDR